MTTTPNEFLKVWMQCVNDAQIESLLSMYNEAAVLIPTFSNRLLSRPAAVREYFERLFSREELSLALHEKTVITQNMGGKIWSMCGIYCWRFAIDGELLNFEARFSYLLDLAQATPILHHHSSQIPRMI
ncbi:MAG: DUF4440 domain-containing protein [Betaproteobacteria bacterium]|nr:DUF4440 domain-containing protein [Betaproteobacteria bacterium]